MLDAERLEFVRMTRDSAAAVVPADGGLGRVRALRYQAPGFDPAVWREMAGLGWIGLRLPEASGGAGMGMPESVALYEALGRGLVPEPLIAGSLAAEVLAAAGGGALLEAVLAGTRMVSVAWQSGADATGVAEDSGGARRLVPVADEYLVPERVDGGMRLRLVPAEACGAEIVLRQDGSRVATLAVPAGAGVVVEAGGDVEAVLDRALAEAALGTAGYLLGVAERAFELTVEYLKQRRQFGQALAGFQALQHRAADMKIQLVLARASVEGAAAELDGGAGPVQRAMCVSRAKARAADAAMLVGREAIQMHGAIGYADECDIGLFTRKAMTVANEFGSPLAHRRRFSALA